MGAGRLRRPDEHHRDARKERRAATRPPSPHAASGGISMASWASSFGIRKAVVGDIRNLGVDPTCEFHSPARCAVTLPTPPRAL